MKHVKVIIFLTLLLLICGIASAEIDKSNGLPVEEKLMMTESYSAGSVCEIGSGTCLALWDISHGVYLNYYPTGDFSQFVAMLAGEGYPVAVTDKGILDPSVDLSSYDILIISTLTTNDSPYSAAEVAAIKDFVDNGGKLLILAENTDCPNGNINPVSQAFGVTTGVSYLSPYDIYLTNLASHPVFNGVSTVYLLAGGELSSTGTIAWTVDEKPAIDAVEGNRVIVIGDSNVFDNVRLGMEDNTLFAKNLWSEVFCPPVGAPEFPTAFIPVTFIIGFAGAVLLVRRAGKL
jgi:hypothetical protein